MSSFIDFFNPTFFFLLGILLIVIAFVGLVTYYESKFREQNHKLTSMLSLVSSLAEEVNGIKFRLMRGGEGLANITPFQQPFSQQESKVEKYGLIEVSDDSASEEEDEEEDEDEDDESEGEEDSASEDASINDIDSVIDLTDDNLEDNFNEEIFIQSSNKNITLVEIKQEKHLENRDAQEILSLNGDNLDDDEDSMDDLESLSSETMQNHTILEDSTFEETNVFLKQEENTNQDSIIDFDTIKKINIMESIMEIKEENQEEDYRKMSVPKLRALVTEKKLTSDSSKLKKPELLKLLIQE
jgi:hypothetical protein